MTAPRREITVSVTALDVSPIEAVGWPHVGTKAVRAPVGIERGPGAVSSPALGRRTAKDPMDHIFSVAIVDDQPVTRTGMEKVVSDDACLRVAASVSALGELSSGDGYDVVLLALPERGSGCTLETIARVAQFGHTVVTSTWERAPTPLAAIRSGASGCVTRHSDPEAVVAALRVAGHGGVYLCARLAEQVRAELARPHPDGTSVLAPREIETIRWIALGFTQSQIATRMGLSQATVNTYAKRIRSKLNAGNKAE